MSIRDYKWTLTALACIGAALLLTRGGLAAVAPLLRTLLPIAIGVFSYRYLASKLRAAMGQGQGQANDTRRHPRDGGQVIDLCPKCGSYLRPGHRCAKT